MELKKKDLLICAQAALNCYQDKDWFKKRKLVAEKVFDTVEHFTVGDVQGYFGYLENTLYIVFRGTDSDADWKTNFKFNPITLNIKTKIKVHSGFLMYYKKVKDKIIDRAKQYRTIVCTGHSLGAGLATLCTENLKYTYPDKDIVCVPLSSPRVGNSHFAKHLNKIIKNVYRIWYGDDTIVRVPPWFFGFRHIKGAKKLMKNYFLPWNWILFLISWPNDHWPDLLLKEMKKQLKDK